MFRPILLFTVAVLAAFALSAPASSGGLISLDGRPDTEGKKAIKALKSSSRQSQYIDIAQIIANIQKQRQCSDANQCSFLEKFDKKDNIRWWVARGYHNGPLFDCFWSEDRAAFQTGRQKLRLSLIRKEGLGKPYASGLVQSTKWHGYGCYEVRMRPPGQEGLITTFFSYTGEFDHAPGQPKAHNEVDVEFVYKRRRGQMSLQANYFTNGKGGNERIIPLSFDPTKKLHNYGFKWTSKGIEWYVDGRKVYTATKNTPKISQGPHKIIMSLWPTSDNSAVWGGNFVYRGKRVAAYSAVRFTRGEDCKIRNSFS